MSSSNRLTKSLRDNIAHHLVHRSVPKKELERHENEVALELGQKILDKFLGTHRETWESLPKKFKFSTYEIMVRQIPNRWGVEFPIAERGKQALTPLTTFDFGELNKPIQKEIEDYLNRREQLVNEVHQLRINIKTVLNGCNTHKQFIECFPEHQDLLPDRMTNNLIVSSETMEEIKKKLIKPEELKDAA